MLTLFLENDIFLYFVTLIVNALLFNMLSEVMNIFVTSLTSLLQNKLFWSSKCLILK